MMVQMAHCVDASLCSDEDDDALIFFVSDEGDDISFFFKNGVFFSRLFCQYVVVHQSFL